VNAGPTPDERVALARAARHRATRVVQRNVVAAFVVVGGWFWAIYAVVGVGVPLLVSAPPAVARSASDWPVGSSRSRSRPRRSTCSSWACACARRPES
jgi:hypothetical protein